MTFDDLHPHVLPFVPNCPTRTVNHHILQAAIEFFSRAHVWKERLDSLLADGVTDTFALPLNDQIEIAKLYTVTVDTEDATVVEMLDGEQRVRDGTNVLLAWTGNRRDLHVHAAPKDGAEIKVVVALKPARTAFELPDLPMAHHADDIANGAIARLLSLPEWANPGLAVMAADKFNDAIATAARQASGGYARRTPRCKSTRFY